MKRIIVPNKPSTTEMQAPKRSNPDPLISDISVDSLIGDGLLALHREMKQILALGAHGKLDAPTARDLRDHVKLLFEIKDREKSLLDDLTDEELAEMVKTIKNDSNKE